MSDNELGVKLKERRVELGLTLLELRDKCGVHPSHLGRIESGQRQPSATVLRKIAEPLGFSEAELLILAGYLSPDDATDRIAQFKEKMTALVKGSMEDLLEEVERL